MAKATNRRIIAAVCCVLTMALMALAIADGVILIKRAADEYTHERLADISDYSGHYVRMFFEGLIKRNNDITPFIARNNDILDEDILATLSDVRDGEYAGEIVVTRLDGAYASTTGDRGTGVDANALLGGGRGGIDVHERDGVRMIRVSTPIRRGGVIIGVLTGLYDSEKIAAALDMPFCGGMGCFHVFMPDGDYVLRSAMAPKSACDMKCTSVSGMQFVDGYSLDELMEDIRAGSSDTVEYMSCSGEHMVGYYTLLGINDWYIICELPKQASAMLASEYKDILLMVIIKLLAMGGMLIAVLTELMRRRINDLSEYSEHMENQLRRQHDALDALGAPPFEFDLRSMEAAPLDEADKSYGWLMERILIPEHASEVVDPRDEAAYLRLCDDILTTRGKLSGDIRLRLSPGAPTRMYRITLSAPEYTGDTASTVATLVDLNDIDNCVETLRLRASRDGLTGLDTLSELKLKATRLIERPMHHFGALAFIRLDNQDAVCDSGSGMTQQELLSQCGKLISEAMGDCDVVSRGVGGEFWAFSGDQTGADIIQKGASRLMNSELGVGEVKLTFSCGISKAERDDGIDELVERAFDAAQLAHRDGGHRVQHG